MFFNVTCQNQIKFISDNKDVQNITTIYKFNQIKHKHIYKHQSNQNKCTLIYTDTKVVKNARVIKAWVQLKLCLVMGLIKQHGTFY